eukprot:4335471-Pyramimonas_sp.AAC.2
MPGSRCGDEVEDGLRRVGCKQCSSPVVFVYFACVSRENRRAVGAARLGAAPAAGQAPPALEIKLAPGALDGSGGLRLLLRGRLLRGAESVDFWLGVVLQVALALVDVGWHAGAAAREDQRTCAR